MKIRKELWFGFIIMGLIVAGTAVMLISAPTITNGHLGLLMLALVVVAIMLGFPTAFTLMGMGMVFTWLAYEENTTKTLDLMVQAAFKVMSNDVLISIPLFVFMGYLVERANLIEKLFKSLHLALARVPGSLAVATLFTCAVFATATGIVGAVVTLMGLLAFPQMLKGGYDVRLSAGAITAGGCLGILIPPSVLLIVYGATAGVSVVQLYAGAFFPGIMLAGLYIVYVIILAKLKPALAPPLSAEARHITLPPLTQRISDAVSNRALPALLTALKGSRNAGVPSDYILKQLGITLLPAIVFVLVAGMSYRSATEPLDPVAVMQSGGLAEPSGSQREGRGASGGVQEPPGASGGLQEPPAASGGLKEPPAAGGVQEPPGASGGLKEPPGSGVQEPPGAAGGVKEPPGATSSNAANAAPQAAPERRTAGRGFWIGLGVGAIALFGLYAMLSFQRLEVFKMLLASFFPLVILILAVLGSIVFGLATPTEAAAVGAFGGFILAAAYRQLNLDDGEGVGVPHRQDQRDGLLAVRRQRDLLGRLRAAGRPGAGRALGHVDEPVEDAVPAAQPGDHLRARLAAGVDGDHRHLHADLHPAAGQLRCRPAVLRPARGAEPADRVPQPAGGDGRVLPEGREPAACDAEPDLRGHAAVHGHPGAGDLPAVHVPGHRPVVAAGALQVMH